jgi:hypothetical protein
MSVKFGYELLKTYFMPDCKSINSWIQLLDYQT